MKTKRIISSVVALLLVTGGALFTGCDSNHETKSQQIINTKEIVQKKNSNELSLIQVTVADNEKAKEIASMYESIDICTNSNCFRADIISDPKDTTIANIAISDFSEPLKYISYKKYNESLYDAHFYYLPKEINLTKGSTHKLYLAKDTNKNTIAFKPSLITMFSPLDKPFLYSPKKNLKIKLKDDFKVIVDENTFDKILTLNISSDKNNDISSKYYLGLVEDNIVQKKEINILIPLNDSNLSKEELEEQYEVHLNDEVVVSSIIEQDDKLYFKSKINRLGFIKIEKKLVEELPIDDPNFKINKTSKPTYYKVLHKDENITYNKLFKNDVQNCLNQISYWRDTITYYTELNGYTLFDNCSKIKPGLFIVSLNTDNWYNDYDEWIENPKIVQIELAFDLWNVNSVVKGRLHTILEHARENKAQGAINGFRWDTTGENTVSPATGRHWGFDYNEGQSFKIIEYAKPQGTTVFRNRTLSSVPLTNIYSRISLEIPTGGTPQVHSWEDSFIDESQYNPYNNLYTSSNVILHNGNCNKNNFLRGQDYKWSAIGVKDGKMLMVSSNYPSGIETNIPEMCQIFKAFAYDEAIRQDGGSATSMVVNGRLLNPLTGYKRVAIGDDARNILYAVTAKVVE